MATRSATTVRAPTGTSAKTLPKPFIPGCDLAGTVEAVGPGVAALQPGQRVWGSNQGLLALASADYLSLVGKSGLRQVAELCYHKAHYAAEQLSKLFSAMMFS